MKRLSPRHSFHEQMQHSATPRRRGAVTIVAMVVLMILAGLIAQQVSRALSDRRHSRQQVLHLQAEKLADAGLSLAATSYAADRAWTGTTWEIPVGSIHQTNSAEVTIRVQEGNCTVVARYPANTEIPFQVTRTRKLTP
jgi:type II secretory pathway component PulK